MDPVSALAGILLSLAFSYVPGASNWYQNLTGEVKRLFMLALCLLVVVVEFGLACANLGKDFGILVTCDRPGAVVLAQAFITAVIANQATYLISPRKS